MPTKAELYNGVCVLSVNGDLAGDEAAALRKAATEQIEQHHIADFVVDMEHSTFVDSEGLETLLWLKKESDHLFGMMKLAHIDENVTKILEITRLTQRFEVHEELAMALKTMR